MLAWKNHFLLGIQTSPAIYDLNKEPLIHYWSRYLNNRPINEGTGLDPSNTELVCYSDMMLPLANNSNHLNTEHLNNRQYGCLVFKWKSHMTWQIIQILDILDPWQALFRPVFRPLFEYRTISQPDTNLPFEYQTSPIFRWLLYVSSMNPNKRWKCYLAECH